MLLAWPVLPTNIALSSTISSQRKILTESQMFEISRLVLTCDVDLGTKALENIYSKRDTFATTSKVLETIARENSDVLSAFSK